MKSRNFSIIILVLCVVISAFSGCKQEVKEESKMIVAVSIVPEQAFVEAVCGNLVEVVVMIPPGFSPESYEPTAKEMVKFADAAIYFSIGVPVEETSILPSLNDRTKQVSLDASAADKYPELTIAGGRDPHVWLSPLRVAVMVQTIADEMCARDPDNADIYANNAKLYIARLEVLDKEIKEILEPVTSRSFIVFHPAFGYFADDYDLEMYALEEHGKEATAARLMEMVDFAREKDIKAVFYQAEVDSSQSAAFAEEIGGRTIMLDPLSKDYIANLKSMASAIGEGVG